VNTMEIEQRAHEFALKVLEVSCKNNPEEFYIKDSKVFDTDALFNVYNAAYQTVFERYAEEP